ncbi:PEP-CTERM sorting domain-containing protein [Bythopirellula polymerisocia]|uniref:PEP-CTERM protein-sorting domain-containing protein n=1 Tax=Bythopirellula polymerisocia TaxID=2528003 RepID=A0A5C6CY78_9BACT|nr:PEP-CTERM sorting domain-containing protein [Bythopirellula polymerisocia]TWU29358.1 hypothetical protein Pla144_01340 [Bythopirellula polymerisocia]
MKSFKFSLLTVAVAVFCSPAMAAHLDNPNLLTDPSFEGTLTFDGPPFVGTWEGFNAGVSSTSEFSTDMPRTGAQSLELNIGPDANLFAGAFQDANFGFGAAGAMAWFSGWHKLAAGDSGGSEIRIEWRDSVANTEISRTPNLAPVIGSTYEEFIVSATVPAGANSARVVYAIQSFGGALNQQVFVDDVNFNVQGVPEPASLAIAGLCLVGLAIPSRRHR